MIRSVTWISLLLVAACSPERTPDTSPDACAQGCDAPQVCAPEATHACVGNDLHVCSAGELGPVSYRCTSCRDGACEFQPCSGAATRLYVLTSLGSMRTFDPAVTPPFGDPHDPSCQTGSPFAMTIDRLGRAWMVMTNGNQAQLDLVDPDHGYCEAIAFDPTSAGFERLSPTFVTDGQNETLLVVGGTNAAFESGDTHLAAIDPSTFTVTAVGALPGSPDLTSTDDGRVFGYFPFSSPPHVAQIDPRDAQILASWDLPALADMPVAWATAYWKGALIVFDSRAASSLGARRNRILSVDVKTGLVTTIDDDSPHVVTGGGVSTCFQIVM